jgi:outer membrane immunogenic protein
MLLGFWGMTMLRFRSAALAAVAVVGFASVACAADMPMKAAPMVAPVAAVNWAGFYVGVNAGGNWGRFSDTVSISQITAFAATTIPTPDYPFNLSQSSFIGGGQIGYRWQSRQWVYGIEGEFDWTHLSGTNTPAAQTGLIVPGDSFSVKSDWQASIRASAGYSWDKWLAYVAGGVAFTGVQASAYFAPLNSIAGFPVTTGSQTKILTGGTIGAGLAYAVNQNWDLGVEYRYTQYAAANFNIGPFPAIAAGIGGPFAYAPANANVKLSTNQLVVRLNYRFN